MSETSRFLITMPTDLWNKVEDYRSVLNLSKSTAVTVIMSQFFTQQEMAKSITEAVAAEKRQREDEKSKH